MWQDAITAGPSGPSPFIERQKESQVARELFKRGELCWCRCLGVVAAVRPPVGRFCLNNENYDNF